MSTNIPEAELLDLPEEDERPKVTICSPKVIILSLLASYFLTQNLYHYITNPPVEPTEPVPQVDSWENFWKLWDRFQAYVIITVVAFILFYYMRQANDRVEEERYLKAKQEEEQAEERERKLQAEREERIIRKLEEEERQAEERQMRAAQSYAANTTTETNQHPKTE